MRFLNFLIPVLLLVAGAAQAAVNDALPADYFPMAPGASTLAVYMVDRHSAGPYKQGQKLREGKLNTQSSVLRVTHVVRMAGQPISLIGVLPWSHSAVGPAPLVQEASGWGDARFGATGWLLNNKDSGEFVGITGMLFLPTGNYTPNQVLNVGENRHKVTLNVGWIHPLSPSFVLEVLPEVAWFGDNTNYLGGRTLSQKSAYALTSYLRYRATPNWQFHLGAQINRGGETRMNGVGQNNAPDNSRLMLGATYLTDDKKSQWIVRFAQDTNIKNGFATESEFLLRYLKPF
jgi:hypothetical protein